MSFDFNRAGQRYEMIAASRQAGFGMLSPEPLALLERLRAQHAVEYSDAERQRWLLDATGCLHRLEGFLFQLSRVAAHAALLRRWSPPAGIAAPTPMSGTMAAVAADEACFDFEGLLFQARAALDRVTSFIARNHNQKCSRFTKLRPVLVNASRADARARTMLDLLDAADKFDGVLVDSDDGATALRSLVAHYSSVPEGRQIAFTIHYISGDRQLIFDCEALGRPLLSTAETLGLHVPFLILGSVAVYAGISPLTLDAFTPLWSNPTVSFSQYRSDEPDALRFTVANMLPNGFSVTTHPLRAEVLEKAIPVAASARGGASDA